MVEVTRRHGLIAAGMMAVAALLVPQPGWAAAKARPAVLSPQDRADVARIEVYLNGLTTLSAKFLQVTSEGGVAQGTFFLNRPGKMRFEYAPPTSTLIVADGTWLVYHDKELNQTTHLPLYSTPVGVLVQEKVALSGDTTITRFERGANVLRISLRQTDDPDQGELTLVFSDGPLRLDQWMVYDAQRVTTRVTLIDAQRDVKLDGKMFYFADPKFTPQSNR